jgi:hypothetical protein
MTSSNKSDDDQTLPDPYAYPSFKFRHELQPPADPNKLPLLPYYDRFPEHRPLPPNKRHLRRRAIRGGF